MSDHPLGKAVFETEIHYENFQEGIEKFYFTVIDIVENSLGYEINKTEDQFLTSPGSAQWQVFEQRKAAQQEKAAQYLANIGRMTKDMMVLYRELKIQDERLGFYKKSNDGDKAAEISLKTLYVDLVQGGAKDPSSVLGLAQHVGFVTLPDLFFKLDIKKEEDIDKIVEKVETNTQVKNVLKRELFKYARWRNRTYDELTTRRHFNIKYLAQHFNVIKMYLEWAKPYLHNVTNLTQNSKNEKSYQILQTSESSISDIEVVCKRKKIDAAKDFEYIFPIITVTFHHRTRPVMAYQGQEYSKGAIQLGRIECEMKGFNLTETEYKNYLDKKEKDILELLSSVDESMKVFLNDSNSKKDFEAYLAEAREENKADEDKTKKSGSILDMFRFGGKKKSKTKEKSDYTPFIDDYRKEDKKADKIKKEVTSFIISKLRKKHKLSLVKSEKILKKYNEDKALSKNSVKSNLEVLYDIIKINYGMIRNE